MSALRTAAQQALEALENGKRVRSCEGGTKFQIPLEDNAITSLRAALAQQDELVWMLTAQRDALLEALKNILPFVATQAIGCHGYKCREQWCWSCYGEEDAEEAASQALALAKEASRIAEEVEKTK